MRVRRGSILLEAMVALAIIAVSAGSYIALPAESLSAVRRAGTAAEHLRAASDFLGVVTLWPRAELEQRLGSRRQGTWTLRIQRESSLLYSMSLLDSTANMLILEAAISTREDSR